MAGKRFEDVYTQDKMEVTKIIRDNETGVLYMFHYEGPASGLTVMVDKDGKPLEIKILYPVETKNRKTPA